MESEVLHFLTTKLRRLRPWGAESGNSDSDGALLSGFNSEDYAGIYFRQTSWKSGRFGVRIPSWSCSLDWFDRNILCLDRFRLTHGTCEKLQLGNLIGMFWTLRGQLAVIRTDVWQSVKSLTELKENCKRPSAAHNCATWLFLRSFWELLVCEPLATELNRRHIRFLSLRSLQRHHPSLSQHTCEGWVDNGVTQCRANLIVPSPPPLHDDYGRLAGFVEARY